MPDITVDWLSFKFKNFNAKKDGFFIDYLTGMMEDKGFEDKVYLTKRYKGYETCFAYGYLQIYLDYRLNDREYNEGLITDDILYKTFRVFVQVSGTGCDMINSNWVNGIRGFISDITDSRAEVSRIDLAGDDFDGLLDVDVIDKHITKGMWRGSANTITPCLSKDNNGKRVHGVTYYIGSRNSDAFIRIYDKAAQMSEKKVENDTEPSVTPEHWVRCELELHDTYANDVALMIACTNDDGVNNVYYHFCYDRIRFLTKKDMNGHYQYDRVARWWRKFLNGCRFGLKLTRNDCPTIDSKLAWYSKMCTPTRALLAEAIGLEKLETIEKSAVTRLSKRQQIMITEYQSEVNYLNGKRDESESETEVDSGTAVPGEQLTFD